MNKKAKITEKKNENSDKKTKTLFKEHEEIIHLYTNEDTLGWNLIYFYIIMNFAIVSAIGLFYSQISNLNMIVRLIISSFCFLGFFVSLAWFFIVGRSRLYFKQRLFRGYQIETELQEMGYPLDTLISTSQAIFKNKILKNPKGEIRQLKWYERIESVKSIHSAMFVSGIIWLFVGIIIWFVQ